MQTYEAYGLHLHSELVLPDLLPAPARDPDVTIRYGEVPLSLETPLRQGVVYQARLLFDSGVVGFEELVY